MARNETDLAIAQAQRTLDNPAVKVCFERLEKEIVDAMANLTLTSVEDEYTAVSLLRDLQAKRRLQKRLMTLSQANKFKEQTDG